MSGVESTPWAVALRSSLSEHRAMDGTRVLAIILVFATVSAVAYVFGRQQNANAVAVSSAFLRAAKEQFAEMRRPDETEPVWVIATGSFHGALGVTDQRLLFSTVGGLDAVDRKDVTSVAALEKNYGGARELWGHEVTLELRDGRRHVLTVIDRADYLPPEHDVNAVLARLA
jgi:hypothetical protein